MSILKRLFQSSSSPNGDDTRSDGDGSAADLPIERYERLEAKEIVDQLSQLSQADLAKVEDFERGHKERGSILAKLGWLREKEPLPGYDELTPAQISEAIADADTVTVKKVRNYERKFQGRREVALETARVLPTARANAEEDKAREAKEARTRQGISERP